MKGAISFGKITVDFKNSIFFGQPIIDAYSLHDELNMMAVILENSAEKELSAYNKGSLAELLIRPYIKQCKAYLKSGKVTHTLFKNILQKMNTEQIECLEKMYLSTSGKHRLYIDNTIEFFRSLTSDDFLTPSIINQR